MYRNPRFRTLSEEICPDCKYKARCTSPYANIKKGDVTFDKLPPCKALVELYFERLRTNFYRRKWEKAIEDG